MGGAKGLRTALLASGALAASALGSPGADAQQAPDQPAPAAQVDFTDAETSLADTAALDFTVREDVGPRFAALGPSADDDADSPRRLELALAAGGGGAPLDIAIAQRASLGANGEGDLDRHGRGSELRVGRGLVGDRGDRPTGNSTYVFVASDNEALTWQPGARSEFGGRGPAFAVQDRVEVGDLSAGVTFERNGVQTSLAYVEREQSARVGNQNFSRDENFAGVTVTMRR